MSRLSGTITIAAVLTAGLILAAPAAAVPIYTCGFEPSEGYTMGNVHGQGGWFGRTDAPPTVVEADEVYEGGQAAQATANGLSDGDYIFRKMGTSAVATSEPKITVSQHIMATHVNEASWVVVLWDDAGQDSAAVLFYGDGGVYVGTLASLVPAADWEANQWYELTIAMDYAGATFDVYLDEDLIAENRPIDGTGRLAELEVHCDEYHAYEYASLYYDSLVVSVPPGPGDANDDGVVDDLDASILGAHWLQASDANWEDGDFNSDGAVNDKDAAILAAHWSAAPAEQDAPAPEPSTLVLLLGAAAAWLARVRRRKSPLATSTAAPAPTQGTLS